jgi:hypothetical protein
MSFEDAPIFVDLRVLYDCGFTRHLVLEAGDPNLVDLLARFLKPLFATLRGLFAFELFLQLQGPFGIFGITIRGEKPAGAF